MFVDARGRALRGSKVKGHFCNAYVWRDFVQSCGVARHGLFVPLLDCFLFKNKTYLKRTRSNKRKFIIRKKAHNKMKKKLINFKK